MDIGTLTGSIVIENEVSGVLTTITREVETFASKFDGAMGVAALSVGAVVTAVGGLSAAIIALGNRGSDINDVAASLNNLAGSAANADAIVSQMRSGVASTLSDFELMGTATKLLAANVSLTAEQFGTLTQAAFALQNEGLGETEEMLNLVSNAMVTGRTRALEMKLGISNTKDMEAEFAKSLGVTKDQLSQAGIAEARRIGILKLMEDRLKNTAAQERDFGENMEFAVVQIKNWGDSLARQVAASPAVNKAVQAIGTALKETFGTTGQTMIQGAMSVIEGFANKVAEASRRLSASLGRFEILL